MEPSTLMFAPREGEGRDRRLWEIQVQWGSLSQGNKAAIDRAGHLIVTDCHTQVSTPGYSYSRTFMSHTHTRLKEKNTLFWYMIGWEDETKKHLKQWEWNWVKMVLQLPKEKCGLQPSSLNPESYDADWPGRTCLQCSHGTDVTGVANYFLIKFRACSKGWNPYLTPLSNWEPVAGLVIDPRREPPTIVQQGA